MLAFAPHRRELDEMEGATAFRPWMVGPGNHEADCDGGKSCHLYPKGAHHIIARWLSSVRSFHLACKATAPGSSLDRRAPTASWPSPPSWSSTGVDVVFRGHVHVYERKLPLCTHSTIDPKGYNNPDTPVYIINGIAGH